MKTTIELYFNLYYLEQIQRHWKNASDGYTGHDFSSYLLGLIHGISIIDGSHPVLEELIFLLGVSDEVFG